MPHHKLSSKSGFPHWWLQRLSAIMLIPCSFAWIFAVLHLSNLTYINAGQWLQNPLICTGWIVFMIIGSIHCILGLEVIIDDYIPHNFTRITLKILIKMLFTFLTITSAIFLLINATHIG